MIRKELDVILEEDFEQFLKENGLFERYINNNLLCAFCSESINNDNIFTIFYDNDFKFCCTKFECINFFNQRTQR